MSAPANSTKRAPSYRSFDEKYPDYGLKDEAVWPTYKKPQYSESLLKPYLADLAKAGLPE